MSIADDWTLESWRARPAAQPSPADTLPGRRYGLLLALPALGAAALLVAVTRRGAYLSSDALAYVGTARNLVDGHGFTPPPGSPALGNFPPLYSLVLAAVGAFGPDPLTVARFVNPLLLGGTILTVGLLARRLGASLLLALGAQLLVLAGTDFLRYYSAALSEPLFLLLSLLTLTAVWCCLERRRTRVLIVAGLLAGATWLTRYVGVAVVASGATALLLLTKRPGRWREAAVFAAIGLAPLAAWFTWVHRAAGRASNRSAVLHVPGVSYVTTGLRTAGSWLLPDRLAWPLGGVVTVALVVVVAAAARRRHAAAYPRGTEAGATLLGLFAAFYLGALAVDRLLFDVTGRLDARFLLVLHVVAVLVAVWLLGGVDLVRSRLARIGLGAVVGLQLVHGAVWLAEGISDPAARLGGFGVPIWAGSEVVDQVRALPASAPVYSNEPDALWFHTGRTAALIPEIRALLTGEVNRAYGAEVATMAADLQDGGLLVYFTEVPARRVFLPAGDELATRLGLAEVAHDRVGVAYRAR